MAKGYVLLAASIGVVALEIFFGTTSSGFLLYPMGFLLFFAALDKLDVM